MPRRILIVDDDEFIRASVAAVLRGADYACAAAADAADGIALAKSEMFDAALIDVHMPGVDGLEAFRAIGHAAPALPIIMMSGVLERDLRISAGSQYLGGRAFLAKPFGREKLLDVLAVSLRPR